MPERPPRRLLFVCTGNICRSPMAQFISEKIGREAGVEVTAASAGVSAETGWGMEPGAVKALAARGLKDLTHAAQQLSDALMEEADEVYALTRAHRDIIVSRHPEFAAKTAVLREAAGLKDADVADPYGRSDATYEDCARRIEEALNILIKRSSHAQNAR